MNENQRLELLKLASTPYIRKIVTDIVNRKMAELVDLGTSIKEGNIPEDESFREIGKILERHKDELHIWLPILSAVWIDALIEAISANNRRLINLLIEILASLEKGRA